MSVLASGLGAGFFSAGLASSGFGRAAGIGACSGSGISSATVSSGGASSAGGVSGSGGGAVSSLDDFLHLVRLRIRRRRGRFNLFRRGCHFLFDRALRRGRRRFQIDFVVAEVLGRFGDRWLLGRNRCGFLRQRGVLRALLDLREFFDRHDVDRQGFHRRHLQLCGRAKAHQRCGERQSVHKRGCEEAALHVRPISSAVPAGSRDRYW